MQAITYTDGSTKSKHRFNFDFLTKVKEGIYVHPVVHPLRNVQRSCNLRVIPLNESPRRGCNSLALSFEGKMKQTKPNKGEGQKHGWGNAIAKADREVDEESNT